MIRPGNILVPVDFSEASKTAVNYGLSFALEFDSRLTLAHIAPFDPVAYANFPELMSGAAAGKWDIALMGLDPQRATVVDFSAPLMNVEQGYLVRSGVPIAAASDVDAPGTGGAVVRAGVRDQPS